MGWFFFSQRTVSKIFTGILLILAYSNFALRPNVANSSAFRYRADKWNEWKKSGVFKTNTQFYSSGSVTDDSVRVTVHMKIYYGKPGNYCHMEMLAMYSHNFGYYMLVIWKLITLVFYVLNVFFQKSNII